MRFGYWMPVFGGWLRNVRDEGMSIEWPYVRSLAVESEQHGFELSLIAELNLNDIKGHRAPSLDCWTLAPAVAAVTRKLELMLAVRPNYHSPSLTAKSLSTLDTIAPGRVSLNVVSSWWKDEAAQYGAPCGFIGQGGTIPLMAMLQQSFPKAQMMVCGVLGPKSNAHGPNEFLDVPYARKLTGCVARVIAAHASRGAG